MPLIKYIRPGQKSAEYLIAALALLPLALKGRQVPVPPPVSVIVEEWSGVGGTPKGQVLWNGMGSEEEVQESRVGPGGKLHWKVKFMPGKTGQGVSSGKGKGGVNFGPWEKIHPEYDQRGTVEFWWQPRRNYDDHNGSPDEVFVSGATKSPHRLPFQALYRWRTSKGYPGGFTIQVSDGDGEEHYFQAGQVAHFKANDWMHVSYVWDMRGLPLDGKPKYGLFVDGEYYPLVCRRGDKDVQMAKPEGAYFAMGYYTADPHIQQNGVLDDVMVWNRALVHEPSETVQVDLEGGLVGHWTFDGNTRNVLGTGHNGSNPGRFGENRFGDKGMAYAGDGKSAPVVVKDHDDLDLGREFTLSAWVKPRNYLGKHGDVSFLLSKWYSGSEPGSPGDNGQFLFRCVQDGRLSLIIANYDDLLKYELPLDVLYGETILPLGEWSHVAAAFKDGLVRLYVNGTLDLVERSHITSLTTKEYQQDQLQIGGHWNNRYRFDGNMDDVRVYNRSLNPAEIQSLANEEPVRMVLYDPSRGTLPTEQGFRLFDDSRGHSGYAIEENVLRQGPTNKKGYQRWYTSRVPMDFEDLGEGAVFEMLAMVKECGVYRDKKKNRAWSAWGMTAADRKGRIVSLFLGEEEVLLSTGPHDEATLVYKMDTTDTFHHYRVLVEAGEVMLFVDGNPVPVLHKGEIDPTNAAYWPNGEVAFGDLTAYESSEVLLQRFWYANDVKAKTPFAHLLPAQGKGKDEGLVLHYDFNNDSSKIWDLSGYGNHGTANGGSFTKKGLFGGAFKFKGGSDEGEFIEVPDSVSLGSMEFTRQLTISAWIQPRSLPREFPVLVGKGGNHPPKVWDGYEFTLNTNADCDLQFDSGQYSFASRAQEQKVQKRKGEWSHVAVVVDALGGVGHFYLNGERIGDLDHYGDVRTADFRVRNSLFIAGPDPEHHTNRAWFDGLMDELRIYNLALSDKEVGRLAEFPEGYISEVQTVDLEEGLVGHWEFDGNAEDASGNGLDGNGWREYTDNRSGDARRAAWMDGESGSLKIQDHAMLDTRDAFTLSAWVKPESYERGGKHAGFFLSKWYSSEYIGEYYFGFTSSGAIRLVLADYVNRIEGKKPWDIVYGKQVLPLGEWSHVVATFEAGEVRLFVNGDEDSRAETHVQQLTTREYTHDDLRIGGHWNGHYQFHGAMDDVRVYNRALSGEEVSALQTRRPTRYAYYDASLGSLPNVQGFRLIDSAPENGVPRVSEGKLLQGPSTKEGYQYWTKSDIPLDFRKGGMVAEWKARVKHSNIGPKDNAGWKASFIDQHGHRFHICLATDKILFLNDKPDADVTILDFDTTKKIYHYRFAVDDQIAALYINGEAVVTEKVGNTVSLESIRNRVYFGDGSNQSGSEVELEAFFYSNDPSVSSLISYKTDVVEPHLALEDR